MQYKQKLEAFSDDELIQRVTDLVGKSRRTEWELVAHIGEVEKRKLYAQKGRSSMHLYCTEVLHLSDAEAYLRIAAARASRKHPMLLETLGDGRLHLTAIAKLAPHLTEGHCETLFSHCPLPGI